MSAGKKITIPELESIMNRTIRSISDVQVNKTRYPPREYNLLLQSLYSTKKTLSNILSCIQATQASPYVKPGMGNETLIYDEHGNIKRVKETSLNRQKEEWEYMFDDNLHHPRSLIYPPTGVFDPERVDHIGLPQPKSLGQ